jgi:hypothetical protein
MFTGLIVAFLKPARKMASEPLVLLGRHLINGSLRCKHGGDGRGFGYCSGCASRGGWIPRLEHAGQSRKRIYINLGLLEEQMYVRFLWCSSLERALTLDRGLALAVVITVPDYGASNKAINLNCQSMLEMPSRLST